MALDTGLRAGSAGITGLSGYHWLVIAAAWCGWGFDVFDALLFNFVAPNCLPTLLQLPLGSPEARHATAFWTGAITSILLLGWAAGGVLFGWVADRIGRRRALFMTIVLYAVGTALCAAATSVWDLVIFRAVASLGIGGEWAIGATLVAETVPENRRVEAGVLLQTSSPLGIVLASTVNYHVAGVWFADQPETSWRYVFLAGLAPVLLALVVRLFVRESEQWTANAAPDSKSPRRDIGPSPGGSEPSPADSGPSPRGSAPSPADSGPSPRGSEPSPADSGPSPRDGSPSPRDGSHSPRDLFSPQVRKLTLSGVFAAVTAVLSWWACNAFLPLLGGTLASEHAAHTGLTGPAATMLIEAWKSRASNAFNLGGLVGSFAAIPLARMLGRRPMFIAYFGWSGLLMLATFGLDLEPATRLALLFAVGAGVYGVFAAFTFYLPELFPVRLRATGAGFCYNIGRVFAAAGPLVVGIVSAAAGGSSAVIIRTLFWVSLIPLVASVLAPFLIVETKDRGLSP